MRLRPPPRRQLVLALATATAMALAGGGVALVLAAEEIPSDTVLTQVAPEESDLPVVATTSPATPTPSITPVRTPTPQRTKVAVAAGCVGPTLPDQGADPSCDVGKTRIGLPSPCISPHHACTWRDARGAIAAGPYEINVRVRGNDAAVTWGTTDWDLRGTNNSGPVREFVLRLLVRDTERVLFTRRYPKTRFSAELSDLRAGKYEVLIYELNDSGLSAPLPFAFTVAPPPPTEPPRTSTPTPSPSPSVSPEPSPSPGSP